MKTRTPEPPALTEAEARRRLGAAYRLLLELGAARRRAAEQNATTNRTADATDHRAAR